MRVQIVESMEADDYRAARVETTAKRKGRDGDFILHKGEYIFTYSNIVFNEPNDVFLKADVPVQAPQMEKSVEMVDTATGEIVS